MYSFNNNINNQSFIKKTQKINKIIDNKKNKACLNCGNFFHIVKNCPYPNTSYGTICYKICNKQIKYVMVKRKHSYNFLAFMKGTYDLHNYEEIIKMFSYMSYTEKNMIRYSTFDELWQFTWEPFLYIKNNLHKIKNNIYNKYIQLITGYEILYKELVIFFNLNYILQNCYYHYPDNEWEFPKGKKHNKITESDFECSVRELKEETKILSTDFKNIHSSQINENFYGTDNKKYKNKYYIIELKDNAMYYLDPFDMFQNAEISDIKFFTYYEIIANLRDYCFYKKKLIKDLDKELKAIHNL